MHYEASSTHVLEEISGNKNCRRRTERRKPLRDQSAGEVIRPVRAMQADGCTRDVDARMRSK
jgi:hypothetical protein